MYATEILENGLKLYPDYPTAYIIYGLAKAYAGDEYRAKEAIEKAADLISSQTIYDFYIKKIDSILEERNSLSDTKRPLIKGGSAINNQINNAFSLEDNLDKLAEQLSNAKIKVKIDENAAESNVPEYSGKRIVSETLAGIYTAQKNYEKAIDVYKELISIHPEKEHFYTQKIVELETLL